MNTDEYISYFREAAVNGDLADDAYYGDPVGNK